MKMNRKMMMVGILASLLTAQVAGAQEIQWIRQFGTWDFDLPFGVAVDASGVYVAGSTFGALPGQVSAGGEDAFVRKYDSNGTELWTRQFGSQSHEHAKGVAVDATGVYVAGITGGTLPGQTSAGSADAFVRKYDANGTELWTRQFGTASSDLAAAIAADTSGVYVAGWTFGALPRQVSEGGFDAFVRKYDPEGNELWTQQFGSAAGEGAYAIAADGSGVYVAGVTSGTLPGQVSAGGLNDAFLRKYDPNGREVWTRQFGTASFDEPRAVAVGSGGVYVAGATTGTFPGQVRLGDAGAPDTFNAFLFDAFVRKYDLDGTEEWTRQFGTEWTGEFGTASLDQALGVAVAASGVYVAGRTFGTLPGQVSAGGFGDAFLRKYEFDGSELWTNQFGTAGFEFPRGVASDARGVYVVGETSGRLPGQTSAGFVDAFVVSFSHQTPQQALQALIAQVVGLNLKQGISNSLDAKLEAAVGALDDLQDGNNVAAINALQAFINSVEAQRGIHISEMDADALIAAAGEIIALLGG